METVAWSTTLECEGCGTPKEQCCSTSRLSTLMPLPTSIVLSGLFWSPPLCKRKRSTNRCVLSGGRTSHRSSVHRWSHPPRRPALSPAPLGTTGVEVGDGVQQSQRATVVGHPAHFSSLSSWGPGEVFLPLQRLRSSHRPTLLDCLLSVFIFF